MNEKEKIQIVVASDNHYAILIGALLKSIECHNHSKSEIDFYIIADGISMGNRLKIASSFQNELIHIHWRNAEDVIPEGLTLPRDHTAFPMTAFLRIFAPYIVDPKAGKVLYMDVDMIVQRDLIDLWNTELDDCLVAAVQDVQKTIDCNWAGIPNYEEMELDGKAPYFNSGLLLMNAQVWRDEDVAQHVLDIVYHNLEHVNYPDQYGLNVSLYQRWKMLAPRWNWFALYECEDPYIIHFLDIKPIFKSYRSRPEFSQKFYEYLNQTSWDGFRPQSDYRRLWHKASVKLKKLVAC